MSKKKVVKKEIDDRKPIVLTDDQLLLNGKIVDKFEVDYVVKDWLERSFVFSNGTVNMPSDVRLPYEVEKIAELQEFKDKGLNAKDVLIMYILSVGIKIGKEIKENEMINKK